MGTRSKYTPSFEVRPTHGRKHPTEWRGLRPDSRLASLMADLKYGTRHARRYAGKTLRSQLRKLLKAVDHKMTEGQQHLVDLHRRGKV